MKIIYDPAEENIQVKNLLTGPKKTKVIKILTIFFFFFICEELKRNLLTPQKPLLTTKTRLIHF